ncbi:MAG: tryptophan synthase subunit alpha [Chloroflexi bacterium 13_1_40CM_4_68_4]|nr:MAG: tryptophan synthase subunit alpha [Chloroflexi bacterium 13_1_40CM_4_68_4]
MHAKRVGLIAYLMAGYPDLDASRRLARVAVDAGADIIELGVPFSDPLADGATIQRASERALANGTRLVDVIAIARELRRERDVPILLMGYANPFYRYGLPALARDLAGAGVEGVIVPDLPYEESQDLAAAFAPAALMQICLVAPTTPDERLAKLVPAARGFVYCVSLTGVTGARAALADDVSTFVARVRRYATAPVAVGFGISRAEHVRALRGVADAVVVGSALVDAADRGEQALSSLVRSLRESAE